MSKSQFSSRRFISRAALVTALAASVLVFMAVGTNAAGFSFVRNLLGLSVATETKAKEAQSAPISTLTALVPQPVAKEAAVSSGKQEKQEITVGSSYKNDTSPA